MRRARVHALTLMVILTGTMGFHALLAGAPVTFAAFSDTGVATAVFEADVPISSACALFATGTDARDGLHIVGEGHDVRGCVHGNADVRIAGAFHAIERTVRHAGRLDVRGNGHDMPHGAVHVAPETYPYPFRLADYAPGGRMAGAAAEEGRYFVHAHGATLDADALADGIHYVEGSARVRAGNVQARVTIVATGTLDVTATSARLAPFADGLLLASGAGAERAISLSAPAAHLTGSVYAPDGNLSLSAKGGTLEGQVVGRSIRVTSTGATFVAASPPRLAPHNG